MFFIITNVHHGSREEYVRNKIRLSAANVLGEEHLLGSTFVQEQVSNLAPFVMPAISLMEEHEFYTIDKKQEMEIDVAMRCALMELVITNPLLEGEEILEDFFTYLREPFEEFPAGTAVLKRRTNMADILFIFGNVRIEDGNLVYSGQELIEAIEKGEAVEGTILTGKIEDIVKSLLGKAAAAAGGQIGALIFNLVIKEIFGVDDNAKFIEAVQKVVREEITSNEIDKINGHIQGTIQFLTNDYQIRKEKSDLHNVDDRKELVKSLDQYSQKFYTEVMGVLEQPTFAEKGLRSYMLGASIHLIIMQELALVDWKTMNPNESSFAETLRRNAKHNLEHVQTVFDKIESRRLAKIGWDYKPDYICDRIGCRVSRKAWAWWDEETHDAERFYEDQHKKGPTAKELAQRGAENRRATIAAQVAESAGNPRVTAIPSLKVLTTIKFPV